MNFKRKAVILIILIISTLLLFLAWRQNWLANWNPQTVRDFINSFGSWAVIVYILLMAVNTITIMPPTLIMIVLSGVLFGPFIGSLALWAGLLLGSVGAFLIARFLAQDFVTERLGGRAARFNEQLMEKGFSVVFIARVLGLPPYEIVNYASGLSKILFMDFLLATMLGSIPGAILFAILGDRLLNPDLEDPLLYAVPTFFVIALIVTRLVNRRRRSKEKKADENN